MDAITTVLIAFALSLDCFAVALAAGISDRRARIRDAARIAFTFGAFQAGMPVLGWLTGRSVITLISAMGRWVAFALLTIVGARMIREGFSEESREAVSVDTVILLALGVATSLDALTVGFSFALLGTGILLPSLAIGTFAFAVSFAGALLGGVAAERWGRTMEILGGLILVGIGILILAGHPVG